MVPFLVIEMPTKVFGQDVVDKRADDNLNSVTVFLETLFM